MGIDDVAVLTTDRNFLVSSTSEVVLVDIADRDAQFGVTWAPGEPDGGLTKRAVLSGLATARAEARASRSLVADLAANGLAGSQARYTSAGVSILDHAGLTDANRHFTGAALIRALRSFAARHALRRIDLDIRFYAAGFPPASGSAVADLDDVDDLNAEAAAGDILYKLDMTWTPRSSPADLDRAIAYPFNDGTFGKAAADAAIRWAVKRPPVLRDGRRERILIDLDQVLAQRISSTDLQTAERYVVFCYVPVAHAPAMCPNRRIDGAVEVTERMDTGKIGGIRIVPSIVRNGKLEPGLVSP